MDKFAQELQTLIKGQVLLDTASLEHYSTDGSIFTMKPWAIVLPALKEDIVNLVKWVKTKKEEILKTPKPHTLNPSRLSITCRGKGTDQAGGPINEGIIVRFPGYLDKILEIGPDYIRVEPGVLWKTVNDALSKIKRFVPCYPASASFATIGGGVANNCAGEKSIKYGIMRDYVLSLKMVIADGKEIEVRPISQEELVQKQSQNDLEGEIYRKIGDLLISNHNLIQNSQLDVNKSSSGYWLYDVLSEEKINLSKLICGAQGTLGIITEITLKTTPRPKLTGLLLASFNTLKKAGSAVPQILKFQPSALEMIDKFLIEMVKKEQPEMVEILTKDRKKTPAIVLFIEFDGDNLTEIKNSAEKVKKMIAGLTDDLEEAYDLEQQNKLWQARRSAAIIAESLKDNKKALPFIEDSTVHPKYLDSYLNELYTILKKHKVTFTVWGHAGNGNVHLQPFLDLKNPHDIATLFKISEEVYDLVIKLKGAISGEHNDGLMRSPYLKKQFGEPLYNIFKQVKEIFDSLNIFNPNKKIGVDLNFIKNHLRPDYIIHIGGST